MSDDFLQLNTSKPEFLTFPPTPALPPFSPVTLMATESFWLLRLQTGAAGSSFCHMSIAYLSGNPVGSTFRTWTEASNHSASWLLSHLLHGRLSPASLRRLPASVLSLPSRLREAVRSSILKDKSGHSTLLQRNLLLRRETWPNTREGVRIHSHNRTAEKNTTVPY